MNINEQIESWIEILEHNISVNWDCVEDAKHYLTRYFMDSGYFNPKDINRAVNTIVTKAQELNKIKWGV